MALPSFITKNTHKKVAETNTPLDIEKINKAVTKKEEAEKKEAPVKKEISNSNSKPSSNSRTIFPIKVITKPNLPIKHIVLLALSVLFFLSGLIFYIYVYFFMK